LADDIELLLKAARTIEPSPAQQEEQRQSFAYGNTAFENPLIARQMIALQAEAIERERAERGDGRPSAEELG